MRHPLLLAILLAWLATGASIAQESPPPDALPMPPLIERADPLLFLIVPEESEIAFDGRATLHGFTGTSQQVDGRVEVIPVAIEESSSGFVAVKAASLTTGNGLRDRNMRKLLEIDRYPEIRFTLGQVKVQKLPSAEQKSAALTVTGRLQVRDVTRTLQLPVEVTPDAESITITGQVPFTFTDAGLTPPSFLFVTVENQLTIRFRLVARLATSQSPAPNVREEP